VKQEVSPLLAVLAVVAVLGVAAGGWFLFTRTSKVDKPPPTMPPSVAQEWQKYTAGAQSKGSIPAAGPRGVSGPPGQMMRPGVPGGMPGGAPRTMPGAPGGVPIGPPR
jgi:hypothetical protein